MGIEKFVKSENRAFNGENNFLNKQNENFKIREYNQSDERLDYNYCTIFASMGTIVTNTGYEFKQDDIVEASLQARRDGIIQPEGATAPDAMEWVYKYVNEKYNMDLVPIRFDIYKDEVYNELIKALENGRAFSQFYKSSSESYDDIYEDGVADSKDYKESETGHMTNLVMIDGKITSINSYKGEREYNRHTRKYSKELLDNDFIYPVAYTFIFKQIIMKDGQLLKDISLVERAYNDGLTNNKQNIQDIKDGEYTQDVKNILFVMRGHILYGSLEGDI